MIYLFVCLRPCMHNVGSLVVLDRGNQLQRNPGVTPYSFSMEPSGSTTCQCKALVHGTSALSFIRKTGPVRDRTHDPWITGQTRYR